RGQELRGSAFEGYLCFTPPWRSPCVMPTSPPSTCGAKSPRPSAALNRLRVQRKNQRKRLSSWWGCLRSPRKVGSPGRTRTCDLVINSPTRDLRTAVHDELSARDSEGW